MPDILPVLGNQLRSIQGTSADEAPTAQERIPAGDEHKESRWLFLNIHNTGPLQTLCAYYHFSWALTMMGRLEIQLQGMGG